MRISKVEGWQIEQALRETPGVAAQYIYGAGRGYRVKLETDRSIDNWDSPRYGRRGFSRRIDGERKRLPGCLCWHGFRDFMEALYRINPNARIVTGVTTYEDAQHFRTSFEITGSKNIGSMVDPLAYRDACDCEEDGR